MLWLVGFAGLMGVGALSLFDITVAQDEEADTDADFSAPFPLGPDLIADQMGLAPPPSTHAHDMAQDDTGTDSEDEEDSETPTTQTMTAHAENPSDVEVIDFDPDLHDLVVVWDDVLDAPPPISVTQMTENGDITEIALDDMPLAHIHCDAESVDASLAVIPLSTAQALGWADT